MDTNDLKLERMCRESGQIIMSTSEMELLRIIAHKLSSIDSRLEDMQRNLWEIKHQK